MRRLSPLFTSICTGKLALSEEGRTGLNAAGAIMVHLKQLNACVLATTRASWMLWIRFSPIFILTRESSYPTALPDACKVNELPPCSAAIARDSPPAPQHRRCWTRLKLAAVGRHSLAAQCLCSVVQRARTSETIWSEALPSPLPSSPPLPLPVFVPHCNRLKVPILYMNINAALLPAFERPARTPATVAPVEFTACKSAGVGQRVIAARVCGGCGSRSR